MRSTVGWRGETRRDNRGRIGRNPVGRYIRIESPATEIQKRLIRDTGRRHDRGDVSTSEDGRIVASIQKISMIRSATIGASVPDVSISRTEYWPGLRCERSTVSPRDAMPFVLDATSCHCKLTDRSGSTM